MSKSMFISILAVVLVVVLGVGMVAALSKGFKSWDLFKKDEAAPVEEVEEEKKEEEKKTDAKEETPAPGTNQQQQTPAPDQNTPSDTSPNQPTPANPSTDTSDNTAYTGYQNNQNQEPEQGEVIYDVHPFITVAWGSTWDGQDYVPTDLTFTYAGDYVGTDGFIPIDQNVIAGLFYAEQFEDISAVFLEKDGDGYKDEEELTLTWFYLNDTNEKKITLGFSDTGSLDCTFAGYAEIFYTDENNPYGSVYDTCCYAKCERKGQLHFMTGINNDPEDKPYIDALIEIASRRLDPDFDLLDYLPNNGFHAGMGKGLLSNIDETRVTAYYASVTFSADEGRLGTFDQGTAINLVSGLADCYLPYEIWCTVSGDHEYMEATLRRYEGWNGNVYYVGYTDTGSLECDFGFWMQFYFGDDYVNDYISHDLMLATDAELVCYLKHDCMTTVIGHLNANSQAFYDEFAPEGYMEGGGFAFYGNYEVPEKTTEDNAELFNHILTLIENHYGGNENE